MTFTVSPKLDEKFTTLLFWLDSHQLRHQRSNLDKVNLTDDFYNDCRPHIYAFQQTRKLTENLEPVIRLSKAQKDELNNHFNQQQGLDIKGDDLLHAQKNPASFLRELSWQQLPNEVLAFYHPFHFTAKEQWGIYLNADEILGYCDRMYAQSAHLRIWNKEILLHLLVFDIFQHEFYHHLVESAATHMEVLSAAFGQPRSIYLDYKKRQYNKQLSHPHQPLEEALANAYAYNALSFICRRKIGYTTAAVRTFQQAIKQGWKSEPAGYRDAALYIGKRNIAGNTSLLEQMLNAPGCANQVPLSSISKNLMPNGYSALKSKPEIPTYVIGSISSIAKLNEVIPALNETYTQLFWPYNHSEQDSQLQKELQRYKMGSV